MKPGIAIVGMACQFPDAHSPEELWENVLAGRRAFRRIPPERLSAQDYICADRDRSDATYASQAAVLEGYEFDRQRFRVAGSTFRQADMAHWLALDVAAGALADAGFDDGQGVAKDATAVLVGNSLTGEFSRANLMRLRWPYVRRVVDAALAERGWTPEQRADFLTGLEGQYKSPFPPTADETLAGGLSNTIAGRICNHFDFHGGGYTVDGACASSLLAVANGCGMLVTGDADVVLAGGVDLSLDPFELVGFAKVGALAREEMRVYDKRSQGFWPGEGCGFLVLMRAADAAARKRRIYATIRGWGISSDGSGGITRPEVEGQKRAIARAYRRAGFGIETVDYFEGHGTGTEVGDATELQALLQLLRQATVPRPGPAAIGSIKANIGHTKAAAGAAGLIKATMALHHQLVPPHTGVDQPHPLLESQPPQPQLELLRYPRPWPGNPPMRAGVSAMGFGGINAHVVLESTRPARRALPTVRQRTLAGSAQDAELLLFSAGNTMDLADQIQHVGSYADRLSHAELGDLAAQLCRRDRAGPVRAAIVARRAEQLEIGLATLDDWLRQGVASQVDASKHVALGTTAGDVSIGLLFPGQGSPASLTGGIWRHRFEQVDAVYGQAQLPAQGDPVATEIAQPAIVAAALAGLKVLDQLEIQAAVAVGHSLGELVAYHWAGAMDDQTLLRLASARGAALADYGSSDGAMASIAAGAEQVAALLDGQSVVIAGLNSPTQTVVSGQTGAVHRVVAQANAQGIRATVLPVSHAFHSPLVTQAAEPLQEALRTMTFRPLERRVASTITGTMLDPDADLTALLVRQLTSPVRFIEAIGAVDEPVDLWIEVGPGTVMQGIASPLVTGPVVSLDAGSQQLQGLLWTVARAYTSGAMINPHALFDGRFTKPLDLNFEPRFFTNPCETIPAIDLPATTAACNRRSALPSPATPALCHGRPGHAKQTDPPDQPSLTTRIPCHSRPGREGHTDPSELPSPPPTPTPTPDPEPGVDAPTPLQLVRRLVADHAELPVGAVKQDDRLLADLHLSSIVVGQLIADASRSLALPPPAAPTDYANATVGEVAAALEQLVKTGVTQSPTAADRVPDGVDSWVRAMTVDWVEKALATARRSNGESGHWQIFSRPGDQLATSLESSLATSVPGHGVLVCLPPDASGDDLDLLLGGAQTVINDASRSAVRFVLVNRGRGGAAVARTLHLENPKIDTCVVHVPAEHPQADEWILAEARAASSGYTESRYDLHGTRLAPVLRLACQDDGGQLPWPLGPQDVLLVTGGGKGIAAECALKLARETGVPLALLGRSQPDTDAELSRNLDRFARLDGPCRYVSADVTDSRAVRDAVGQLQASLGPITAVLHGAGTNQPKLLPALTVSDFQRTLAPKVLGLNHVLTAIDPQKLRLLVTFGSIIARTGMPGEADYALANQWVTCRTENWQVEHPHCRCLALEWSVWSGVGMGQRLGRVDALKRQGIMPIRPDAGVEILVQLLQRRLPSVAIVVTGRFGQPPTLTMDQPALPLYRFLEQPRVVVPGVELIADARLSHDSDPYLSEHVYQDSPLLPAVMGLEAMAQVASALTGAASSRCVEFRDVEFRRPVVVPRGSQTAIRLASLMRGPDEVEVALRSEETDFQTDHFRGFCRTGVPEEPPGRQLDVDRGNGSSFVETAGEEPARLSVDPRRDLYGEILFHRGRFQCVRAYRRLRATECVADIEPSGESDWFRAYLPSELSLGDPASRDAVIHAIQVCIPDGTILPVGVDRIWIGGGRSYRHRVACARERSHDGDMFVYDVDVVDQKGGLLERWRGLRLRRVGRACISGGWHPALLGPLIERRLGQLIPAARVSVVVDHHGEDKPPDSDAAIVRAVGRPVAVHRRADGKPVATCEREVSVSHAWRLTMAVAGRGRVACDLEPVMARPAHQWADLLRADRLRLARMMVKETSEELAAAATRVWTATECLKKSGAALDLPLVVRQVESDGWVVLGAGETNVATWVATVRGLQQPLAVAILTGVGSGLLCTAEPMDNTSLLTEE